MKLETLLRKEAGDKLVDDFISPIVTYREHNQPEAVDGTWLEKRLPYIWKIGVLAVLDGNKRDWAWLYVGYQRLPSNAPVFLGCLHFPEGENDDASRTLDRVRELAHLADVIFEKETDR